MKLWVFSDLHLEFGEGFPVSPPDADVCVVAGDILSRGPEHSLEWLAATIAPHMPVVFVSGNHEFYGGDYGYDLALRRGKQLAAKLQYKGVHFLENDSRLLGGVRFVGCTLWTDFELDGDTPQDVAWAMQNAGSLLSDFGRAIADPSDPSGKFSPQRSKVLHERSRTFLRQVLAQPFDGPTVVVSHHAPHRGSLHSRYHGSPLNPAFVSDLEDLIFVHDPHLWVHGHTHDSFDYRVGDTRAVCNPKGYGDENRAFKPGFVVEV